MANANINEQIVRNGYIRTATKLPVITIAIGRISTLKNLTNIIWHRHHDGRAVIATKDAPTGYVYDEDRTVIVRIINGKVKMNGFYNIHTPTDSELNNLLNNPFELSTMPSDLLTELKPLLDIASEIRPSIEVEEANNKVIIITDDMVDKNTGFIYCHCSWNPDDVLTKLYPGDIFFVEDEDTCTGYRIGMEEFYGTHKLND